MAGYATLLRDRHFLGLVLIGSFGVASFFAYLANSSLLVTGYGFLGLVIPSTAVLALEEHGAIAGTASALMGTLQFVTGAVVIAILGRFIDGTSLPMVAGIATCAVISFAFARTTLRHRTPAVTSFATD